MTKKTKRQHETRCRFGDLNETSFLIKWRTSALLMTNPLRYNFPAEPARGHGMGAPLAVDGVNTLTLPREGASLRVGGAQLGRFRVHG